MNEVFYQSNKDNVSALGITVFILLFLCPSVTTTCVVTSELWDHLFIPFFYLSFIHFVGVFASNEKLDFFVRYHF